MASDLFGDITRRRPSVRPRRPAVVIASIACHGVVFLGALSFSLAAPGLLPAPRAALAFVDEQRHVRLTDIVLPPPPRPVARHADATETPSLRPVIEDPIDVAPVIAPAGIVPETDRDSAPSVTRPSALSRIEGASGTGNPGFSVGRIEQIVVPTLQAAVRLHSGIQAPLKLVNTDPVYPALARSARVQGVVILEAVIDRSGRVESIQVIRSIPMLDQAAVAAVRQWRYTPALLNGSPVPVIITITVNFKL